MRKSYAIKPRSRQRLESELTLSKFMTQYMNPLAYSDPKWRTAQQELNAAFIDYARRLPHIEVWGISAEEWHSTLDYFVDEFYPRTFGRTR